MDNAWHCLLGCVTYIARGHEERVETDIILGAPSAILVAFQEASDVDAVPVLP